jgi:hypothetical protein
MFLTLWSLGSCANKGTMEYFAVQFYLKEYFNTGITEFTTIDDVIFAVDVNGLLRIKIPKLDMSKSSKQAIFDQFLKVLNAAHKYFCQTKVYKPIDWRDYFNNITDQTFSISWGGCNNVTLDFSTMYGERYITDTDPSWQNYTANGDDRYYYTLKFNSTNIPALTFVLPDECANKFYDFAFLLCP